MESLDESLDESPDESYEDLDLSVIEDDSSESGSEESVDYQEREPLSEIDLFFIYMDYDNAIEKIETTSESLDETGIIGKERLLQIVQTKRSSSEGKKYRLHEIMAFQLPIEYSHLDSFIKGGDVSSDCLQPVPIFNEIVIHPALYIFHDLTAIYFFFSESVKPLKSVLRNGSENRVTKKVRIREDGIEDSNGHSYIDHKRKSLKRFMRRANSTRKTIVPLESDKTI
jgi:hypothetical protein